MLNFKKNNGKKITDKQLKELLIYVLANFAWLG